MTLATIHKTPGAVPPNLTDLEAARRAFRWDDARVGLAGLPAGGLNIAHEALDRHLGTPAASRVALRWRGRSGEERDFTYAELAASSSQFAHALGRLGVRPGEVVFGLLPRVPELYAAVMGTLKHRAVFSPLFPQFGPEPIATRVSIGRGAVLVTTAALYQRKVLAIRERLPHLRHVIVLDDAAPAAAAGGVVRWHEVIAGMPTTYAIEPTPPETLALLHFTSGTTGRPKGAMHAHAAVIAHHATGRIALDLHPDDVFWCTADPGWVTGMSYGVIAPFTHGVTNIVDEGEFDAERWYHRLAADRVTVWYTAPTAIRMLMRAGPELARRFDLSALRFAASVGEPLNPEAVVWGHEVLGVPFHDNWWQTETGGIMIANLPAVDIRPGSMGKPLPGVDAGIVDVAAGGEVRELTVPDQVGQLALRPGWPAMFRGYLDDDERYRRCFAGGWYLTGDLARRDADGYYWFVGRADDVIKSAGHLIGPFEVESALLEHPAVAEAAVIGLPDPVAGEVVKAFVAVRPPAVASDELNRELLAHARRRLGPAIAPRTIAFATELPRTRSGKLMRRLLRARELGLPEGDTSTLEGGA